MQQLIKEKILIEEINKNEKNINTMNFEELAYLRHLARSSDNKNTSIIEKALSPISNMYICAFEQPYWFANGTKFIDNIWYIKLTKNVKTIDFSKIYLSNDVKLTDEKEILNTFKSWIIIQGSPKFNRGQILNKSTIIIAINKVLILIDNIIKNNNKINLIERKCNALDLNFFCDILINISKYGVEESTYNYNSTIKDFLLEKIKTISEIDLIDFEKKFPLLKENYTSKLLNMTLIEVRKSRYWLFQNKAYKLQYTASSGYPNSNFFKFLFKNYITINSIQFNKIIELKLFKTIDKTEYSSIPCKSIFENTQSIGNINNYIDVIKKLIHVNTFKECSPINKKSISQLSVEHVKNHIELQKSFHFRSVPTRVILTAVKNAFEFIFNYMDDILESLLNFLNSEPKYYTTYSKNWKSLKEHNWKKKLSPNLKDTKFTEWKVNPNDINCFHLRRSNIGFCDLYKVLMGAIQLVIGAITARRQSELIELSPIDCLLPRNIDPIKNKDIEFEIVFNNRKSGIGGESPIKESLGRPIPNSIANIIYKLQKFNLSLINSKNINVKSLSLFNNYNPNQNKLSKIYSELYNSNLNSFCDYFQTPLVKYDETTYKRFYIRQHQLRRFFALLFFWSKSYDGLDSLRHFLGHTNPQHLYNYITENITGEVLTGVKAQTITEQLGKLGKIESYIKNIEQLTPILEKYFNIREFEVLSEDEIFELYSSHDLTQHLKKYSSLEQQVNLLLEKHIIELEPNFFTVKNSDGQIVKDFNLILRIKDEL
ncbi:hypothetical protein [Acinetobacter calcoaceticus]